jgi:plasmid stability protein
MPTRPPFFTFCTPRRNFRPSVRAPPLPHLTFAITASTAGPMNQLLVRTLEAALVRRLRARARQHGVSIEEEHRRILHEACLSSRAHPNLIDFLRDNRNAAAPDTELDLTRSRQRESRGTGF